MSAPIFVAEAVEESSLDACVGETRPRETSPRLDGGSFGRSDWIRGLATPEFNGKDDPSNGSRGGFSPFHWFIGLIAGERSQAFWRGGHFGQDGQRPSELALPAAIPDRI